MSFNRIEVIDNVQLIEMMELTDAGEEIVHEAIERIAALEMQSQKAGNFRILCGIGKVTGVVFLSNLDIDTLKDIDDIIAPKIPNIRNLLAGLQGESVVLSHVWTEKPTVYYPASRAFAAKLIKLLGNGKGDPVDKIKAVAGILGDSTGNLAQGQTVETVTATYYLSCLVALVHEDIGSLIEDRESLKPAANYWSFFVNCREVSSKIQNIRTSPNPYMNVTYFHALFSAFAFCRSTSSKTNLANWCKARFNSLMNSLSLQTDANIMLTLGASGQSLNMISSQLLELKELAYRIQRNLVNENPVISAFKQHIRMLIEYSGMTTFLMINKVICYGGPILAINPIPVQLMKYLNEKRQIVEELSGLAINFEEIKPFLNILYPRKQYFKAADYPDLILVAKEIEIFQHPESKETIEKYISKSQNASINRKQVRTFLHSSAGGSFVASANEGIAEELRKELGIDLGALATEANKVIERAVKIGKQMGRQMYIDED